MEPHRSRSGLAGLEQRRRHNLRQLLLRASRRVNRDVVAGLQERGYTDLRSTHTALLSHIDLTGSTVTQAAERAGMTKQAMGRLAGELRAAGYITVRADRQDARARVLHLTRSGMRLMIESFEVMAALEEEYGRRVGKRRLGVLLQALEAFVGGEP